VGPPTRILVSVADPAWPGLERRGKQVAQKLVEFAQLLLLEQSSSSASSSADQ